MRLLLLVLAVLTWTTTTLAQPEQVPAVSALKQQLARATADSLRLRLCTQLSRQYYNESQFDSLYVYALRGLRTLDKTASAFPFYASDLAYFMGRYYRHKGQYQEGIASIKKALAYARSSQNATQLIECQYALAMLYSDANDLPKAVDQIGENLAYLTRHEDGPALAENYLLLISLFRAMHSSTMEKLYTDKYLALDKRAWPAVDRIYACLLQGELLEQKGAIKAAAIQYRQAMYFARLTKTPLRIIEILEVLGVNMRSQKNYEAAINLFNQSFNEARNINSIAYMASAKRELAATYLAGKQTQKALSEAQVGLKLARQNREINSIMASLSGIGDICKAVGNYREALQVYMEEHQIKEQKFTEQNTRQIAQMQAMFEVENKNKMIKILQKTTQIERLSTLRQKERLILAQRTQLAAGIIIALLIALMGLVYYFLQKSQRSNSLLIQQQVLLRKTAAELSETNAVKDKLFSLISHDLRSPMASMKININQIREVDKQPELFTPLMNRLDKQVDTVLMLLTNLLDWSMIQLKGFQAPLQPVNLSVIAEETISQANEQLHQKQLTIINQVDRAHAGLADKHQLRAVLRNVLSNAIKFTPVGGYIRLYSTAQGDAIELQVRDSGLGMTAAQIETLFSSPEIRTGTTGEQGTGLGLRICREMMDRQHGALLIESPFKGGTLVRIRLKI